MRLTVFWIAALAAGWLTVPGAGRTPVSPPDDGPKPEPLPAAVEAALDAYVKAVEAKDPKAAAAAAAVPWLDRDRSVVRDPAELGKALGRVAGQLPKAGGKRKVEAFPYKKVRDRIKDEARRKLLDEVLGHDGWLVDLMDEGGRLVAARVVLVRVKDGKAAVVGGPLKQNQFSPQNRIPESVGRLLDKAESFELYSLDPGDGWKVLGKTEVKREADRKKLAEALRLGAEDNFGIIAGCFIPRHGVRLKQGDKTVDLVICFECLSVRVFEDGKESKEGFLTTGDPQKEFDAVLKEAGVKLPKPAKD